MWFTENPWPPLIILSLIGLIFLGLWNSNRRNLHLLLAVGCFALAAGVYFLERAIQTEGELLQQQVVQLCYDFRDKSPRVPDYFSDAHPELKALVSEATQLVTVHPDLRLSDFQSSLLPEGNRAIRFRANATLDVSSVGNVGYQPAQVELVFQRETGGWKIVRIRRFNPLNGREMEPLQRSPG